MPSEELISFGRKAIRIALSSDRNLIDLRKFAGVDRVAHRCLAASAPKREVQEIVALLCDGVGDRFYSVDLEVFITTLIITHTQILLDEVFTDFNKEHRLIRRRFKDGLSDNSPSINSAPAFRLIEWCRGELDRIVFLADAVCVYTVARSVDAPLNDPQRVVLSEHIKALLDNAVDKLAIVERIAEKIKPWTYAGSRADIMESRLEAFAELQNHSSSAVRDLATTKFAQLKQEVRQERDYEVPKQLLNEQRFEN